MVVVVEPDVLVRIGAKKRKAGAKLDIHIVKVV